MQIPLVVALWEHPGYKGRKRILVEDAPHLGWQAFDDVTSAVGVHPGPDLAAWITAHGGLMPTVALYEHPNYGGRFIILQVNQAWTDLSQQIYNGFHDRISSVRMFPAPPMFERELWDQFYWLIDVQNPERRGPPGPTEAHTIAEVPLLVELYKHPNFTGDYLVIAENTASISNDFGADFNDSVSSVRVRPGSGWAGHKALLYPHPNFKGDPLKLDVANYPNLSTYPNLAPKFNDAISSVKVT